MILICLLSKKNTFGLLRLIKKKHVKEEIDFIDVSLQSESIINGTIIDCPVNTVNFAEHEDDSDLKENKFTSPAELVRNHVRSNYTFVQADIIKGFDEQGTRVRFIRHYIK